MMRTSIAAFNLATISVLPAFLFAKAQTDKIMVAGGGLAAPIEITASEVRQFEVWAGPGIRTNGVEQREGFIIDWSKGTVADRPIGLQQYKVSFYSKPPEEHSSYQVIYVVLYAFDPSTSPGYIYLPNETDDYFGVNERIWHGHGFEGHWTYATPAWESFIRPLIAKAITPHLNARVVR